MKLGLIISSTALVLSVFSVSALAENTTSVVDMAKENGIKRCLKPLEAISNFIIDGKKHGTHASWSSTSPDNRMYTSVTSKAYSDGNSHISIIGAINSEGKCDTYYMETYALSQSCMVSRETAYKKMNYVGTLADKTIVLKNEGGANYYLSPQGTENNLCLVSKRETLFP